MIILIVIFYYSFAILGVFFWRYFRQFIAMDFHNDKKLNRRRRMVITYYYCILALSAVILGIMPQVAMLQKTFLVISAGIILVVYAFFVATLEAPSRYKKRKSLNRLGLS